MDLKDLENRFNYHAPKTELNQTERYEMMRKVLLDTAHYVVDQTPESMEQSLAVTKLEEAMYWANSAIARNE